MTRLLLSFSCLFIICCSYGQEPVNASKKATITGRIIDSATKSPIEYATITIIAEGTNKTANGTTAIGSPVITKPKVWWRSNNAVHTFLGQRHEDFAAISDQNERVHVLTY